MMIEPITVGLIGLGCLAILVVIGMQVAYAGALVGLMGIVVTIGARRVRDTGDFWDHSWTKAGSLGLKTLAPSRSLNWRITRSRCCQCLS